MKIGINLLLWTGHVTPQEHGAVLRSIAAAGYNGVEVPVFDGEDPAQYHDLAALLDDLGLERTVSTAFTDPALNPVSAYAGERQAAFDQARRIIDCAAQLEAELVVGPLFQPLGHFTGAGPTQVELDRCAQFLRDLAPHARTANLRLAVEPLNRFEAHVLNTCEQARSLMQAVDDPGVGVLFDTFHAHIEERDPVAALAELLDHGHVAHVHISENDRGTPGKGQARIGPAIALLKARDYQGWLTIEAFGQAVPELAAATRVWRAFFADPDEVVSEGIGYIRRCLAD